MTRLGHHKRESGSVMVLVALWLPLMVIFGSFALDAAHFWDFSRNLQNRVDAAALAAGDQYGSICFGTPTQAQLDSIGKAAQTYSGVPSGTPDANLPYAYSAAAPYQNTRYSPGANSAHFHLILNGSASWDHGGVNFQKGNFCSATYAPAGAATDVWATQAQVPLFFKMFGFTPNISAHARVAIQSINLASNLRPLAVRDPNAIPCVKVNFVPVTGGTTRTIQLQKDAAQTQPNGPDVWDNTGDNGGSGDQIFPMPAGNVYMQTVLYAQGSDGTCNTMSNPTTYDASSGLVYLNTYGNAPSTSSTAYLDPTADGAQSQWTKSAGTNAWSLLNDGVRQPTAPSTASGFIRSTAVPQNQDLILGPTPTWQAGDTYTLWVYGNTAGETKREVDYAISTNSGGSFGTAATLFPTGTSNQWKSANITGSITSQAALNGLRVRLSHVKTNGNNDSGTATIYAAYIIRTPTPVNPVLVGSGASGGGVTLLNNGACSADQYFSTSSGCQVKVCADVWFDAGATNRSVTVNGAAMTPSTDPNCSTSVSGATAYLSGFISVAQLSGTKAFSLAWSYQDGTGTTHTGSFGQQQQAFGACNETTTTCSNGTSGPIVEAEVGSGVLATVGSFKTGTNPYLLVRIEIQGLQNAQSTDRCLSTSAAGCTLLRFGNGNTSGSVDCGQGNGTSAARSGMLAGCPLFGQTTPPVCTDTAYCGSWIKSSNGLCNNLSGRTTNFPVNCVNSNNNGVTIPECAGALIQTGGSQQGNGDPCNINGNTGCSIDHWLVGDGIPQGDPRVITAFIVYPGDLYSATGNTPIPIREFASFYVTGWQTRGNGKQIDCPASGPQANEPPPSNLGNSDVGIWGHWISYVELGGGGSGQACNFGAFGDCTPVLTR